MARLEYVCRWVGTGAQEGHLQQVCAAAGLQQLVSQHHPGVQHLLHHSGEAQGRQHARSSCQWPQPCTPASHHSGTVPALNIVSQVLKFRGCRNQFNVYRGPIPRATAVPHLILPSLRSTDSFKLLRVLSLLRSSEFTRKSMLCLLEYLQEP